MEADEGRRRSLCLKDKDETSEGKPANYHKARLTAALQAHNVVVRNLSAPKIWAPACRISLTV